jgi:hypothetical protein
MSVARRETAGIARPECEANLTPRYRIERAPWIWHPARVDREQAMLEFRSRLLSATRRHDHETALFGIPRQSRELLRPPRA